MMTKRIPPTALHCKGENTRSFIVYTIWDNRADEVVIVDGEARDCAKAMGLTLSSFYSTISKVKNGIVKRWTIKSRYLDSRKRYTKWVLKGGAE